MQFLHTPCTPNVPFTQTLHVYKIPAYFKTGECPCKTKLKPPLVQIVDNPMRPPSVIPGGVAHSDQECSVMSNVKTAIRNIMVKPANPIHKVSSFTVLSFLPSLFAFAVAWQRQMSFYKINNRPSLCPNKAWIVITVHALFFLLLYSL